ncbi:RBBP9/YdeN family alpha/beta hydrolase [Bordetella pertussis]|uniref:RBBP9/YdeN family alpha/beta hydrolase n=1 Tax=Bordetella pertussis TaxID=520 RepID=UPI0006DCFD95|nr:alpha/beta hydrolase [Bordetella pertussis]
MRLQPIIVPGWQGSGPGHWQTHWSRTLPHAVRLQQRDWHQPQRAEWVAALAAAVDAAPTPVLPYQSVVIASDDDPYCRLERARQFAQDWGSRLVVLQGAGHINADSQLGAWPQGLKQLAALRRRACWRISPPAEKIPPVPAGIMAPPRYG